MTLHVLVNNKAVKTYSHQGDTFIEGRPGSQFTIKITNPYRNSVKAIVSVDGLSVIDGKPAGDTGQGYIIEGYGSIDIDGWRVDNDRVREFVFEGKNQSYSNKTGHGTKNTGVIGVRLFQEQIYSYDYMKKPFKSPMWKDKPYTGMRGFGKSFDGVFYDSFTPTEAYVAASTASNLGTGMGESVSSYVKTVSFEAQSHPSLTKVIYYDDRRGLEKRGIIVNPLNHRPLAFPESNFCKEI